VASTGCDASANHRADDGTDGKPDEHPDRFTFVTAVHYQTAEDERQQVEARQPANDSSDPHSEHPQRTAFRRTNVAFAL
jgi:MoxR-like ATPase